MDSEELGGRGEAAASPNEKAGGVWDRLVGEGTGVAIIFDDFQQERTKQEDQLMRCAAIENLTVPRTLSPSHAQFLSLLVKELFQRDAGGELDAPSFAGTPTSSCRACMFCPVSKYAGNSFK